MRVHLHACQVWHAEERHESDRSARGTYSNMFVLDADMKMYTYMNHLTASLPRNSQQ